MHLPAKDTGSARQALGLIVPGQLFLVVGAATQAAIAPQLTGFPYGPSILALTHLLALGWATVTCLGALCQLLPVLLGEPLRWPGLVRRGAWPLVAGCALFSWAFAANSPGGLALGAALLTLGLAGPLASYGATLAAAKRWDVTTVGVAGALCALGLQLTAGVLLVANRRLNFWPGLGLPGAAGHAALGLLGWLGLLTITLSYRLLPMFTLAHGYVCRFRWPAALGVAGAGIGAWLALWLHAPAPVLGGCALATGAAALLWLADVRAILRRRARRLEPAIILFVASGGGLALLGGLALAGAAGWLSLSDA
ncbi:MAG TPA: hypothetical protein VGE07_24200, partial [Herpetosiphonaceae bacterium]